MIIKDAVTGRRAPEAALHPSVHTALGVHPGFSRPVIHTLTIIINLMKNKEFGVSYVLVRTSFDEHPFKGVSG